MAMFFKAKIREITDKYDAAEILKKKLFFIERCIYCQDFFFLPFTCHKLTLGAGFCTLSLLICDSQGLLAAAQRDGCLKRTFFLVGALCTPYPSLSTITCFPLPSPENHLSGA